MRLGGGFTVAVCSVEETGVPEIKRFKPARVWRAPLLKSPEKRSYPQKHLRISHPEYGEGEAVFEKQCGFWILVKADEQFHWLKNKLAADVRIILQAEGATWEWKD